MDSIHPMVNGIVGCTFHLITLLALWSMRVNLNFREASESDVPALVDLLADDLLGAKREDISIPLNPNYLDAFHSIEADSNNELTVVEADSELVGML